MRTYPLVPAREETTILEYGGPYQSVPDGPAQKLWFLTVFAVGFAKAIAPVTRGEPAYNLAPFQ